MTSGFLSDAALCRSRRSLAPLLRNGQVILADPGQRLRPLRGNPPSCAAGHSTDLRESGEKSTGAGTEGSQTHRWREMDSNHRYRIRNNPFWLPPFGPRNSPSATKTALSCQGPMVRIHLPPADSPSLARIRFRSSRTPAFRAGVRGGLATGSAETRRVFRYRANRRQYLCRAIFRYRRAADGVGENVALHPTKSGLLRA
jgi:hypothetical protein